MNDPGLGFESQKITAMKTIIGATGESETCSADWITVLFHFLLLIRGLCSFFFLSEWASLVSQTGKESACNAGDPGLTPGLGRSPGEGNSQLPIPVFLYGEPHGQRSLAGYSPWSRKESDTTK